jgi:hypothetical protein
MGFLRFFFISPYFKFLGAAVDPWGTADIVIGQIVGVFSG